MKTNTLSPEPLHKMDAYWRAASYLSVRQIYPYDNPLLKESIRLSHVRQLVAGHWGTLQGQKFIYFASEPEYKRYELDIFRIAELGRSHSQNPLMKKDKQCQELHSHRNSADVWRGIVRK